MLDATGAESRANAHLPRPFGDAAGQQAVGAHGGKNQRRNPECLEDEQREPSIGRGRFHALVHHGHADDRLVFVDR